MINHKMALNGFAKLMLILSITSIAFLSCNENATASIWSVEKLEEYQSHPDWVGTRCQNMEKVNQRGVSNFSDKVALLEKEYNPNFSSQNVKEIIEFYRLFGQKFCAKAW
jgi:hypothetical protein